MQEIISMFIDEMPNRISEFRSAWEASDLELLSRLSHQIKGAAPGYGFTPVGEAAAALERTLKGPIGDVQKVQAELDSLLALCQRVVS